ncbi:MAG: porin family protein [Candidatus Kapabacteria bacterium]|nr:porin family protein [Candidatus Kapabacteria bacterium]
MKTRYTTIIAVVAMLSAVSASAQTKGQWSHQLGADIGIQLPMANYFEPFTVAVSGIPVATTVTTVLRPSFGFTASYYYRMSERFFLSASAGILMWGVDSLRYTVGNRNFNEALQKTTLSAIPVTIGMRYNFATTGLQPYVGFETGVTFFRLRSDSVTYTDYGKTRLALIPKVGVRYPIESGVDLDLNAKYLQTLGDANFSNLGINIGISYTFRELEERARKNK